MPNVSELALYAAIVALGVIGVVLIEILPRYLFASSLVYGQF